MDSTAIQQVARARAEELPAAEMTLPFGPDYDVAKVLGKMFLLLTEVKGTPVVVLKAEPRDAEALRGVHPEITPGYHMNKVHWNSIVSGPGITPELLKDLITDSYLAVVAALPARLQPVDPQRHGLRQFGEGF